MSTPWFWTQPRRERWDLEYAATSAYGEASRLRSQLTRLQGGVENKVDRLTAAFEAFVELSDIRADMTAYADAGQVRHHVRELLAAAAAGRTPELPDLPEVPGYWLVPAARALYARLTGEPTRGGRYAAAATELDADRTRYFLAAALRLTGPPDLTAVELAALLPAHDDKEVNRAQRTVWLATAAGAFGDAGRALLSSTLAANLGEPAGEMPGPDDLWQTSVYRLSRGRAADALAALRERCAQPAAPGTDTELAPLAELVATLVDEGHEPERDLLRRIRHLRGLVEQGTAPPEYRPWYEPAGTVAELVCGDIFDDPAAPGARRVAVRAATPWLRRAAATLAEQDRAAAESERTTVLVRGREVPVTDAGPDPDVMAELRRQYTDAYRPNRTRQYVGLATAVVGMALGVLGFVGIGGVPLGLLGIVLLLVGAAVAITGARAAADTIADGRQERASLEAAVRQAIDEHRATQQRAAAQRDRLDAELAALSEALR